MNKMMHVLDNRKMNFTVNFLTKGEQKNERYDNERLPGKTGTQTYDQKMS